MKTLLKIVGGVVALLIVLLIIVRITGFPPKNRRPGLWITGPVATAPVTDWSFTDQYFTIQVQTNPWYGIAHSVNTFCIAYNGQLYLASIYPAGAPPYPGPRVWDQYVARDPHVRLKIGGQIYDRVLVHVTDPAEHDAVIQAQTKKYPNYKYPATSGFNVFRVTNG
jgi:hypothetical protein